MKFIGTLILFVVCTLLAVVLPTARGGDWDSLNNLLKDVVFSIPDIPTFTAGTYMFCFLRSHDCL